MGSHAPRLEYDLVVERRRAVALARHYRDVEDLSIAEVASRLGRSAATIKAYFYDSTGEKERAVKARYVGVCRGCGAYTQPRNDKGDAYAYCKRCHPGAIQRRWPWGHGPRRRPPFPRSRSAAGALAADAVAAGITHASDCAVAHAISRATQMARDSTPS